ncbi:MAG: NfeD family protein [Lachnospiraceae bacterium]
MSPVMWLVIFVILLGVEIATMALTTIWFAVGALAAFALSFTSVSIEVQLAVFVVVSFAALVLVRPFAKKYVNGDITKTNADSLIGKQARVTAEVDNLNATGAAVINGQEWMARSVQDDLVIQEGTIVTVKNIQGVKLIVEAKS